MLYTIENYEYSDVVVMINILLVLILNKFQFYCRNTLPEVHGSFLVQEYIAFWWWYTSHGGPAGVFCEEHGASIDNDTKLR